MMPDKLNSKIKESLRDSESPFDPAGWDRLERNLDAKGTSSQFKFKVNWKYSLNTVLVVVAGSVLIAGAIKLTNYIGSFSEDAPIEIKATTTTEEKKAPVADVKNVEPAPTKEVVVQQFFPTQVYNIQYPLYNGAKYTGAPNDQVALESFNPEGEFSEQVKNRPLLTNPLVRGYILGESPVSNQQPVVIKQGGSQLKLTPDELRLFSDPSLLNTRRELIFGDQIDSKQGYILPSKEADSMKKIMFYQEHPDLNPELMNTTKEEEKKIDPTTNPDSDKTIKKDKEKKEKKKKVETKDGTTPENGGDVKPDTEEKKKNIDKPKDGGTI